MPELPDISAYIAALEARILGQPLEQCASGQRLLSAHRRPARLVERRRRAHRRRKLGRIGKRIAMAGCRRRPVAWLVLHLMIAGRLHWKAPQAKLAGRNALAGASIFRSGRLS